MRKWFHKESINPSWQSQLEARRRMEKSPPRACGGQRLDEPWSSTTRPVRLSLAENIELKTPVGQALVEKKSRL